MSGYGLKYSSSIPFEGRDVLCQEQNLTEHDSDN